VFTPKKVHPQGNKYDIVSMISKGSRYFKANGGQQRLSLARYPIWNSLANYRRNYTKVHQSFRLLHRLRRLIGGISALAIGPVPSIVQLLADDRNGIMVGRSRQGFAMSELFRQKRLDD
jgi:hypothetical protein